MVGHLGTATDPVGRAVLDAERAALAAWAKKPGGTPEQLTAAQDAAVRAATGR